MAGVSLLACSDSDPRSATPTAPNGPALTPQPATATYEVTFDATWTRQSHPVDFPSGAHFSRLVGGTHDRRVHFWEEGRAASAGIEQMAERGQVSPLDLEIERAVAAGTAGLVLRGEAADSPGRTSLRFVASQSHPLVSLVTMVAPSPDWFVGVSGLDLFAGGAWVPSAVVALYPWDAGTDGGATFDSENLEERPHRPIAPIATAPLAPDGFAAPLGTLTFLRVD